MPALRLKKKFFRKGKGGRKGERHRCVREVLPLTRPELGMGPATLAHALTRNQTGDLFIRRPVLSPLSHAGQGHVALEPGEGSGQQGSRGQNPQVWRQSCVLRGPRASPFLHGRVSAAAETPVVWGQQAGWRVFWGVRGDEGTWGPAWKPVVASEDVRRSSSPPVMPSLEPAPESPWDLGSTSSLG